MGLGSGKEDERGFELSSLKCTFCVVLSFCSFSREHCLLGKPAVKCCLRLCSGLSSNSGTPQPFNAVLAFRNRIEKLL